MRKLKVKSNRKIVKAVIFLSILQHLKIKEKNTMIQSIKVLLKEKKKVTET